MLLGTGPPTSLQCAFTATKPVSCPSKNTGIGHGDVVQVVAVALVRIVVDEDVAFAERVDPAVANRRLDRKAQMPLEHRQPDPLRDHLHVGIEDGAAEVEALADDVVVRGLDHRDPHALGGRVQARRG